MAVPKKLQTPKLCSGQTTPGATNWQVYNATGIYLDVDTSSCGFTVLSMPLYYTSLGGNSGHWFTTGATAIYVPTATGFRVYVHFIFPRRENLG